MVRDATLRLSVLLLAAWPSARAAELAELHHDNFDEALREHDDMLVLFHAPHAPRCQTFAPLLERLAGSAEFGARVFHAKNDLTDARGWVSYIEHYGILRLPTLVLFRNGHPSWFGDDKPVDNYDAIVEWLDYELGGDAPPRRRTDAMPDGVGNLDPERAELLVETRMLHEQQKADAAAAKAAGAGEKGTFAVFGDEARTARRAFAKADRKVEREAEAARARAGGDERFLDLEAYDDAYDDDEKDGDESALDAAHYELDREGTRRLQQEVPLGEESGNPGGAFARQPDDRRPRVHGVLDPNDGHCRALEHGIILWEENFEVHVAPVADPGDMRGGVGADVFVMFHGPHTADFCATAGVAYGHFAQYLVSIGEIVSAHFDVSESLPPAGFGIPLNGSGLPPQLPLVMLWPARDKRRPRTFTGELEAEALVGWAHENLPVLGGDWPETEEQEAARHARERDSARQQAEALRRDAEAFSEMAYAELEAELNDPPGAHTLRDEL